MTTRTTPHPSLAMVSHGADLIAKDRTDAIENSYDGLAALTALVNDGKLPPTFLVGLGKWADEVKLAIYNGQPIPALSGDSGIKPEYRTLIDALDRGELTLNPDTGLPKAADESAAVDNLLQRLEKAHGMGVVAGDTPEDRAKRLEAAAKSSDKLGEVATALGLAKDAKTADVVAAANNGKESSTDLLKILAEIKKQAKVETKTGESTADFVGRVLSSTPKAPASKGGFGLPRRR